MVELRHRRGVQSQNWVRDFRSYVRLGTLVSDARWDRGRDGTASPWFSSPPPPPPPKKKPPPCVLESMDLRVLCPDKRLLFQSTPEYGRCHLIVQPSIQNSLQRYHFRHTPLIEYSTRGVLAARLALERKTVLLSSMRTLRVSLCHGTSGCATSKGREGSRGRHIVPRIANILRSHLYVGLGQSGSFTNGSSYGTTDTTNHLLAKPPDLLVSTG